MNQPRICVDRVVPDELLPAHEAAEKSILSTLDDPGAIPTSKMAIIRLKRWPNGSTLRCRFLDGSKTQSKRVEAYAHVWEQFGHVKLQFVVSGDAEIRISFSADTGSWSALGTDALIERFFPKFQPTMNYGWLKDDTPDEEYSRVVLHKFGHALGAVHEHQSPKARLKWNKAEVYRVFTGPPNFWSKADIDFNIFKRYSILWTNSTEFDPGSIMLYGFPASMFLDRKGTKSNKALSDRDKQFIAQMYPKPH
jgi:hypothetical protein